MKLLVATPCYRSDPELAIAWATALGRELGVRTEAACPRSPPWLHIARARLAGVFWDGDCNAVLWRDDDVYPSTDTVRRMLAADVPAIVAPYVIRDEDEAEPVRRFDVEFDVHGQVRSAGLGCALLRRPVIAALWHKWDPELGFVEKGHRYVAMFRDFIADTPEGVPVFLKEDAAFWWRVRHANYRIEALDDVLVPHAGEGLRFKKGTP
jgi:hypothetical protein